MRHIRRGFYTKPKKKWKCKYDNNCYRCPLDECEFNKLKKCNKKNE